MTGKKDARRKRSGKIVRRKRQNETRGITAKEISSVNGDNPYPGSNDDDGMDAAKGERWGRGERKDRREGEGSQKGGTTLSWFPSGGFIMASSYYRRIYGHDADLLQGTKTDLTSARIYGTSAQMEKENLGRKDARYPTVRITDKDCRWSDNDRIEIGT